MEEIWKDILKYKGLYKISNLGRVMTVKRTCKIRNGQRTVPERILKLSISTNGYFKVGLSKMGVMKNIDTHRLIARAFVRGYFKGAVVNHKDGNKLNNQTDNLEWVSVLYNNQHAKAMGLLNPPRGANHVCARRVVDKSTGTIFPTLTDAAKSLNLSKCYMSSMLKGRQKNITQYDYA